MRGTGGESTAITTPLTVRLKYLLCFLLGCQFHYWAVITWGGGGGNDGDGPRSGSGRGGVGVGSGGGDIWNSYTLVREVLNFPPPEQLPEQLPEGARRGGHNTKKRSPYQVQKDLSYILSQRPNWRTDFDLAEWLPGWLAVEEVERWKEKERGRVKSSSRQVPDDELPQTARDEAEIDSDFWSNTVVRPRTSSSSSSSPSPPPSSGPPSEFTIALASNGLGHRLAQLSYAYLCHVVPTRSQLLLHWLVPALHDNRAWHLVFENSPVVAGVPGHWRQGGYGVEEADGREGKENVFERANRERRRRRQQQQQRDPQLLPAGEEDEQQTTKLKQPDCPSADYDHYYDFNCGIKSPPQRDGNTRPMCADFKHPRDLWLLRIAREPSAQEFYMVLRSQLRQVYKDRMANFVETNFPKDKLVVGVHVRGGNGKDDGQGHFDLVNRGDWLRDLPKAVRMVRKHVRMVAHSMLDRYGTHGRARGHGGGGGNGHGANGHGKGGVDFNFGGYDDTMDGMAYRIFLATDSPAVLDEFIRQDGTVLSLPQDRLPEGEGVAINTPVPCGSGGGFGAGGTTQSMSAVQCAAETEASMLMDAFLMSSCDAILAESYSNFMYTIPATLAMAEGRVFCEAGRAALGGKYLLGTESSQNANMFGEEGWWVRPPSNVMPVRCYQGGWAARDRSDLSLVEDVA